MKKGQALLTMLGGLVLGVAAGTLYARPSRAQAQTWMSCPLLAEAQEMGVIDKTKRDTLIAMMANKSVDLTVCEFMATPEAR